jgi:two-component system CheB/CheR fusion protein
MADTADAAARAAGQEGPLVLVVDDNADARSICEHALRPQGYRIATAESGDAALIAIDALRPALVVLDLAMPGTDGFTVAHAIRANPCGMDLPILVCTGLGADAQARARAVGGTIVCQKPVEPRQLVEMVRRLCPAGERRRA